MLYFISINYLQVIKLKKWSAMLGNVLESGIVACNEEFFNFFKNEYTVYA